MNKSYILDELNAIDLYQSGKTLSYIAKLAHCRECTVFLCPRDNNIQIRPRGTTVTKHPIGSVIGNWEVISNDYVKVIPVRSTPMVNTVIRQRNTRRVFSGAGALSWGKTNIPSRLVATTRKFW